MSGRILVVDDIETNRLILNAKLATAYFEVLLADSGKSALELATAEMPDMILLDVMMPEMGGYEVCRRLKANPDTAHIPVIMVTAANTTKEKVWGLEAGADDFLSKPINDVTLFARVRHLMRVKMMFDELKLREATSQELGLSEILGNQSNHQIESGCVLLANSKNSYGTNWEKCIRCRLPHDTLVTEREGDALDTGRRENVDVFVVAQYLADGGDGLRLVSNLRANPITRQAAIILVVEDNSLETAAKGLELGASDYIHAPFDINEMMARLRSQMKRKKYSDRLRSNVRNGLRMAIFDPLTGLYNRRYVTQHMQKTRERAHDSGLPYAVLMLDLDRFKSVNDNYGHEAGDAVLKEFARRLQENLRGIDLVARLGGEEFLVILPDTGPEEVEIAAERLRQSIDNTDFSVSDGITLSVTVSIGVAFGSADDASPDLLIDQADKALYQSKATGRNRVTYYATAA